MSLAEVFRFYAELGSLPELRETLTEESDPVTGELEPEVLVEAARGAGFDVSEEDFSEYREVRLRERAREAGSGSLSDADLEAVSGGVSVQQTKPLGFVIVQTYPATEYDLLPKR